MRLVYGANKIMIDVRNKPFFVSKYRPDHGGTDFLGLRAVNVLMMDECFPGINNVSRYIRPFSIIAWIHWKFHQLSVAAGNSDPTNIELRDWQEKIETLFTWGHVLNSIGGLPGTDAKPPGSGYVPLDFKSWKRTFDSTSLMAAIQYGPPAKSKYGLAIIETTEHGLSRATGEGVELAKALESKTAGLGRYKLTEDIARTSATEADAKALFPGWSILKPSPKEKSAFWNAYYSAAAVGEVSRLGKRSSTVQLILDLFAHTEDELTVEEVRSRLFHGKVRSKTVGSVSPALTATWHRWICLQLRQAQRLGFDSLMGWVEYRLRKKQDRTTDKLVDRVIGLHMSTRVLPHKLVVGDVRDSLVHRDTSLDELAKLSLADPDFCIFNLMGKIREHDESGDELQVMYALRLLLLCAAVEKDLFRSGTVNDQLQSGGAERISLHYWSEYLERSKKTGLKDFVQALLEQHVISQHLSVAARRYDGGTQRLRISIEEEGLIPLVVDPLPLNVTRDRLHTALCLISDCGFLGQTEHGTFKRNSSLAAKA
jgi:hypothetical protein